MSAVAAFATDDAATAAIPAKTRPRLVLVVSAATATAFSKSIEALTASWLRCVVTAAGLAVMAPPKNEEVMVMDDAIGNIWYIGSLEVTVFVCVDFVMKCLYMLYIEVGLNVNVTPSVPI